MDARSHPSLNPAKRDVPPGGQVLVCVSLIIAPATGLSTFVPSCVPRSGRPADSGSILQGLRPPGMRVPGTVLWRCLDSNPGPDGH